MLGVGVFSRGMGRIGKVEGNDIAMLKTPMGVYTQACGGMFQSVIWTGQSPGLSVETRGACSSYLRSSSRPDRTVND